MMNGVVVVVAAIMTSREGGAVSVSAGLYKPRHLADLLLHHTALLSYEKQMNRLLCLASSEQPPKHFKIPTDLFDVSSIASRLGKSSFAFGMHSPISKLHTRLSCSRPKREFQFASPQKLHALICMGPSALQLLL